MKISKYIEPFICAKQRRESSVKWQKCKLRLQSRVLSRGTQSAWNWSWGVSLEKLSKWRLSNSGQKIAKKVENFQLKLFYLQFLCCRSRPKPARAAHRRFRANITCNPMPQCFQIWQVSAKYCTFLDFLAHCCALLSKSFWKRPSMMTIFWVTRIYQILAAFLRILAQLNNFTK